MTGKLILIPAPMGGYNFDFILPPVVKEYVKSTDFFIVENIRTARRYISNLKVDKVIDDIVFFELNKHTKKVDLKSYLTPLFNGNDVGVLSEAGVPCVADPGSAIVSLAHEFNIEVVPLVGPSSILLALMASGLNGQDFAFVGYLPIQKAERVKRIRQLEQISGNLQQTQLFIETPYRNAPLFDDIVSTCRNNTQLCIGINLTLEKQFIKTETIGYWKKNKPAIEKQPAIFIIHANK